MDTKTRNSTYAVYNRPTSNQKTYIDWNLGDGKRYSMQMKIKKVWVAILISDKIDFNVKTITRGKEGDYVMIKGSIQEEDITVLNIYAPNIKAPQYIRQMLTTIKEEIDCDIIIVGNFKTPLTPMDRSSR